VLIHDCTEMKIILVDWLLKLLPLLPFSLSLLILLVTLSGCATDQVFIRSQQAIEDQGYTFIIYEGRAYSACGEDDFYSLKYSATSRTGRRVTLAACSGIWKGVTVRTIN